MGEAYVEVYAQAAYARDAGNPSGGEETTLAHVSWSREGGFTNSNSWYEGEYKIYTVTGDQITVTGPTYGKTPEQIRDIIDEKGNLNSLFDNWNASLEVKTGWINYVASISPGCVDG